MVSHYSPTSTGFSFFSLGAWLCRAPGMEALVMGTSVPELDEADCSFTGGCMGHHPIVVVR